MTPAFAADMKTMDTIMFAIPGESVTAGTVAPGSATVTDGRTRVTVFRLMGNPREYRVSANFHIIML